MTAVEVVPYRGRSRGGFPRIPVEIGGKFRCLCVQMNIRILRAVSFSLELESNIGGLWRK